MNAVIKGIGKVLDIFSSSNEVIAPPQHAGSTIDDFNELFKNLLEKN